MRDFIKSTQPHDDLPGCRFSDTLILPQKEFWVGNDICVSRGVNIYDEKTNKFTSCRYALTFKIETKFLCKVTNAWDNSGRWLVILFICSSAGQALHCCEHCSVCRVMRLMRHIAGLMTRVRSDMGAIYTLHYCITQTAARPAAK